MKTTFQGKAAEGAVADLLRKRGYKILDRNWRTRTCEIDLIVLKDKVIYFVEVKFRSQSVQGSGFDYITKRKQDQMAYAALNWCQQNNFDGDYRLMAAAVSGDSLENIDLVEV